MTARSAPIGNPPRGGKGGGRINGLYVFHFLRVGLGAMSVSGTQRGDAFP